MSAPYRVWIVSPWRDRTIDCQTLGEAIAKAMIEKHDLRSHERVRVIGDGYDCDSDQDGFFESSDGLTDDERELVEGILG